jgi:hypothetical protein
MAFLKEKVIVGKTTTSKLYEIVNRIQDTIAQTASFRGNATEAELDNIKAQHLAGTYEPPLVPGDVFNVIENAGDDLANYIWNGSDWDKTSITFKINDGIVTDPTNVLKALQVSPDFNANDSDQMLLKFTTDGVVAADNELIKKFEVNADITPTVTTEAGYDYELELPSGYRPISVLNVNGIFTPLFDSKVDGDVCKILVIGNDEADGSKSCGVVDVLAVKVEL